MPPIVPAPEIVDSHDWGDGILQIAEDRWVVSHAYAEADNHRVTATATDVNGDYAVFGAPGSVDTRFGERGTARVDFGPGVEAHCHAVMIQPDGKIVLVGYVVDGSTRRPAVARLNADGTPDTTFFGTGGTTFEQLADVDAVLAPDVGLNISRLVADWADATLSGTPLLEPTVVVQLTVGPMLPELGVAKTLADRMTATDASGGTLVASDDFTVTRLFEDEAALDLGGRGGMLMMSPPTATGELNLAGPDEIDEGDVYTLSIAASDLGTEGEYIAALEIDWGDGSDPSTGDSDDWGDDITQNLDGTWTVTHPYADDGNFAVVVEAVKADAEDNDLGSLVAYHPRILGDANLDGVVDDADATILACHWQQPSGATWQDGDFNGDGAVNDPDAAIFAAHYGEDIDNGGGQLIVNDVIEVTTLDDVTNANDGYISLREALAMAAALGGPDKIRFDGSLSAGGTITLVDGQLEIDSEVTIEWLGASLLTIDADGEAEDSVRAFYVAPYVEASISGMTITGGYVDATDTFTDDGGAIYVDHYATLTVTDCVISENTASGSGGGIYGDVYSAIHVVDSLIDDNHSLSNVWTYGGGGIYSRGGGATLTLAGSTVSGNTAAAGGGGIVSYWATVDISASTIENNESVSYGGGIYTIGGSEVVITNGSIVSSNESTASAGGGIFIATYGSLTLSGSIVSGNTAHLHGGGIHGFADTTITITDSTVSDNIAETEGGGIQGHANTMTVTSSTISGNSANYGGGLFGYLTSAATIINSTIADNSATAYGGGIYGHSNSVMTLTNATVADNTAGNGGGIYRGGNSAFTLANSIVARNAANANPNIYGTLTQDSGYNVVGGDPKLMPIANEDEVILYYLLQSDSPAVDAGSNALAVDPEDNPLVTDMLGNARIHNVTVDIGATELSLPELEVDATTPDTVDEGSVFTLVLDYSDPDSDAVAGWTIDWGDETETTDTIADGWLDAITDYGSGEWTITHTYANDGEYDIEITVTDEHGASETATAEVTVDNVAPTLRLREDYLSEYDGGTAGGLTYGLVLSVDDPGADSIDSWTITWDDEVDPPLTISCPAGSWDWEDGAWDWGNGLVQVNDTTWFASHTYAEPGSYLVTATATDEDGTWDAASSIGNLDWDFGDNGRAIADFGVDEVAHGFSVATLIVDDDEKIVTVGYAGEGTDRDFAVAMFNSDGTPYAGFFSDGTTTLDIAGGADEAYDVVIQTIDAIPRILVVGKAWNGATNDYDFALARFWQDPTDEEWKLDAAFDEDGVDDSDGDVFGVVLTDLGGLNPRDEATAVALQSDGAIVVAGNIGMASDSFDFAVVRYNEDGRFDDDFGVLTAGFYGATENDWVRDVVIQSDGKIIVAGEIYDEQDPAIYHMAMARFRDDVVNGWELDPTFGPDLPDAADPPYDNRVVDQFLNTGKLVPEFPGSYQRGHGLALDSADNIVLVGQSSGDFAALRFGPDGDWDTTFDADGIATVDLGGSDVPQGAILRDDGTVVVGGWGAGEAATNSLDFCVVRFAADGSHDVSYGDAGLTQIDFDEANDYGYHLALDASDNLLLVGNATVDDTSRMGLTRLVADGHWIEVSAAAASADVPHLEEAGGTLMSFAGSQTTVDEGSPYVLSFSAAGASLWVISWGDGTFSKGTASGWGPDISQTDSTHWTATHTYADGDASHTIRVTGVLGDASFDGKVDDVDASILGSHWHQPSGATWGDGDFNGDGRVGDADAAIMAAHWEPTPPNPSDDLWGAFTVAVNPAAPSDLTTTAASDAQINLHWTDNSDIETGYKIERMTGGSAWTLVHTVGAGETSYSDTGRTEGTAYYYRVRATTGSRESDHSGMSYAITLPTQPSSLTVTFVNGGQANLNWTDRSSVEVGYSVEQWIDGDWRQIQTTEPGTGTMSTMSASVTGAFDPSVDYSFRVRAYKYDFSGDPLYSLQCDAIEMAHAWPAAPTGLTATPKSDTRIDLSWLDIATDETGYKIERSANGVDWTPLVTLAAGSFSYPDTGLTEGEGTLRYYRVRATNNVADEDSAFSNTTSATTLPKSPGGLQMTVVSGGQIDLDWQDLSSIETGYSIEQLFGAQWQEIATADADATSQTLAGRFEPGTAYSFRVTAYRETEYYLGDEYSYSTFEYSAPSNVAVETMGAWPSAPAELTATAVSDSQTDLAWVDNANNEEHYEIDRTTDGITWTPVVTLGAGDSSYSDTGLAEGTLYCHRVRATNAAGGSGYSLSVDTTWLAAPGAPQSTLVSGGAIGLAWTDNSDAEWAYSIEQFIDDEWQPVQIVDPDTMSGTIAGPFEPETQYHFRVKAWTPWAESLAATVDVLTGAWPLPPASLTGTVVSGTQIDLQWSASTGAVEYTVEMQEESSTEWVAVDTVTAPQTTCSVTGLAPGGAEYSFRVAAVNGDGSSAFAALFGIATENLPPTVNTPTAGASPVTGTSTTLSVTAEDDGGEDRLTYTWTLLSGENVWFSENGTNAAQSTTVTFGAAGDYAFQVTVADALDASTTSTTLNVTVDQTLSHISVTPDSMIVWYDKWPNHFQATGIDQFGNPKTQGFDWSLSEGAVGSISYWGSYLGPGDDPPDATFSVIASYGGISGTATVFWEHAAGRVRIDWADGGYGVSVNSPHEFTLLAPVTLGISDGDWPTIVEVYDNGSLLFTSGYDTGPTTFIAPSSSIWYPSLGEARLGEGSHSLTFQVISAGWSDAFYWWLDPIQVTRLETLTVTDRGGSNNTARATDSAIRELYIPEYEPGDSPDAVSVDFDIRYSPQTEETAQHICMKLQRNDGLILIDDSLADPFLLSSTTLPFTKDCRDFVFTTWYDEDGQGDLDEGEDRRTVNIYVREAWTANGDWTAAAEVPITPTVTAGADGASLRELAKAITDDPDDAAKLPICGKITKGQIIDVTPLVAILEKSIRDGIVAAAQVWPKDATFATGKPVATMLSTLNELQVKDVFDGLPGGINVPSDCEAMTFLASACGLIGELRPGEFDALFKAPMALWSEHRISKNTAAINSLQVGDALYFKNNTGWTAWGPTYKNWAWQGEWVVLTTKVGPNADIYWGFPFASARTKSQWAEALLAEYNAVVEDHNKYCFGTDLGSDPLWPYASSVDGYQPGKTWCVDCPEIAQIVFQHRTTRGKPE
ncbi:MAG: fibronectin type III domain-containing protein [Planctomycetia bacterium]|nr:fibronectin type III domain-containing protein [Planctomycetia bacterium]